MSKTRRKVTVEGDQSSDEEGGSKRSKPSVFERLGPGASSSRKSFEGERQDLYQEKCRNWLKTGSCHYGPTCRFIHGPFKSGRSKRKGGDGEEDSADEGKHRKHRAEKEKHKNRSQSLSPKRQSRGHGRKEKDGKMKSAVIVKKSLGGGGDSDRESDTPPWDAEEAAFEDLDYKDELQLEQKRQELERVLQQLQPSEEERENITIEKKQNLSSSSGSSSSSSGSSSSGSSSSSSGSPSPPRKKSPRRPKTPPPRRSRSPPRHHPKSPPHAPHQGRSPPPPQDRSPPYRDRPPQDRSPSNRNPSPHGQRDRPSRREITPPAPPRERSPPSSPARPPSPRRPASGWSPEKGTHSNRGGKPGGKKKKFEKHKDKSRSRLPQALSPGEWDQADKHKDKSRSRLPQALSPGEWDQPDKHKDKSRSRLPQALSPGEWDQPDKHKDKSRSRLPQALSPGEWDQPDKHKDKSRSRLPQALSPGEWDQPERDKERRRQQGPEKEKVGHKEKHKRRPRSPVSEDKPTGGGRDGSLSPDPRGRSKPGVAQSPSPEPERKRSGVSRHDTGSEYDSPLLKAPRRSVSPPKERSKRGKKRGRTLSVSPLRTKKLSPGPPKSKDLAKDPEKEHRKEKVKLGSMDPLFHQDKPMDPVAKERSRGRSPAQAVGKSEKHKKKKESSEKKKRHDSPDLTPPSKHSRKRRESPETPVKGSRRGGKEKGGPETPGRRSSRSKSGKRKDGRKGQKGQVDWEHSPSEPEEKSRSRGDIESSRMRPSTPEMLGSRGRDKRRSSPQEMFDPRSRSGDSRRPSTPPPRRPESPPEVFRPGMRGTPPRFARSSREEPGFASSMRRRGDEDFIRPPGSASPPGRRGREGRYRDDFEPGLSRRDPDGPSRLDRFMDPRDRDRLGRFPELRPPLYDDDPGVRMEQERLFEMERARFEREDRLRGREGFDRERFGRDRFSGRPDRFDDGRGGPLGGRDPRGLGISGPPWEREFGSGGLGGRGLAGDRFPGRGGFDEDLPERLSRRAEWESRHLDFREEWGPRGRDDRRDMRLGRRGEYLDIRDGRRFDRRMDDQGMFRRLDPEEMLRLRLEGDFRDRREPSDPRENPYADLRRDERGERRDDRMERGDEAFDRGRRDDRLDERLLRREERDGRMDRRDIRKRAFDMDDDKAQSPPPKRLREHSPSAMSLRSHGSNLDEARAVDWERAESRRRDQSQDTDRGRRDRDQDTDRPGKRGRDMETERFGRDAEKPRDRDLNQDVEKEGLRGKGRDRDSEGRGQEAEHKREKRRKGEESDRSGSRKRGRDRGKGVEKADGKEAKDPKVKDEEVGPEAKPRGRAVRGEGEPEADCESVKSGSRESGKERESRGGSGRQAPRDQGETLSEGSWSRSRVRGVREKDNDTQSEKGWQRGRNKEDGEDKGSVSGRSQSRGTSGDRPQSEHGDTERGHGRERHRRRSAEEVKVGDRGDAESEKGSSRGSLKDQRKSQDQDMGKDRTEKDTTTAPADPTEKPESETKGDKSEKYDPFAVESEDEASEGQTADNLKAEGKPDEADTGQKPPKPERRLSHDPPSPHGSGDSDRKKHKMIELAEGRLTETVQTEGKSDGDQRHEALPFTGEMSDKEELKSAGGEVYSDWSSADDADDILGRPEALPFTNQPKAADTENGDSRSTRSNHERRRRSASRSSHGSRRDVRSRDERSRDVSRDERGRMSRASSRHSSYDRHRDERRRYGSTERVPPHGWDRGDHKPALYTPPEDNTKHQQLQHGDEEDLFGTSMDYEAISDDGDIGDDDESDTKGTGVVSALQIDWSSLTQDHRPATQPGSALQRFKPARVFQRIGIEKAYAGKELLAKLTKLCQRELEEKHEAPKETGETGDEGEENGKDEEEETKKAPEFKLHHDIAAFHATTMYKLRERSNLFRNIGSFRRALCARKDLDIRRQLCRLDKIQLKGRPLSRHRPITGQT